MDTVSKGETGECEMSANEDSGIVLDDINCHWMDPRGNKWSVSEFTRDEAKANSSKLRACYDCVDCTHCTNCVGCRGCRNCDWCFECVSCHECSCVERREDVDHVMEAPPGDFYYMAAITRKAFGYYWDSHDNVWSTSMFTLSEANQLSESMSCSEGRNLRPQMS